MTRDEALLVLNDHLGERVEVIVAVGDDLPVVSAEGVLSHWSQRDGPGTFPPGVDSDDAAAGIYRVGDDASVYLSEGWVATILQVQSKDRAGITFELASGVGMTVSWGVTA